MLYCPTKTKKTIFSSLGAREVPGPQKIVFFLGQYSTFARNLTKTLYCTTKTTLFLAKVLYCPPKKNNFSSLGAREVPGPQKIGYFGTVQHFCKKLNKNAVLYHKNHSFFASAVLSQKKAKKNNCSSLGAREVPGPQKIGYFGTVQHCKKLNKNAVLYHKNHSFFAKVLYCPKKKQKNNFSSLGAREVPGPQKIGYFGTVQHFCRKLDKNAVLSQKNLSFWSWIHRYF